MAWVWTTLNRVNFKKVFSSPRKRTFRNIWTQQEKYKKYLKNHENFWEPFYVVIHAFNIIKLCFIFG